MSILDLDQNQTEVNQDINIVESRIRCVVKWFRTEDGYGFLQAPGIQGDIFIHSCKLNPINAPALMPLDVLECKIVKGLRGPQVEEVYTYEPGPKESGYLHGIIKWFNSKSDFGFVTLIGKDAEDLQEGTDVFLPGKRIRSLGFDKNDLKTNQRVIFTIKLDSRGNKVVDKLMTFPPKGD